jgi:phosphatidylserine synthase
LELDLNPPPPKLRWFSGLWFPLFGFFVGLALYRRLQQHEAAVAVWVATGLVSVLGTFFVSVIRPVYVLLIRITLPIGWIISHVILAVLYFLVITLVGLLVRLFRDPMNRRFDRTARTYWVEHKSADSRSYLRQS